MKKLIFCTFFLLFFVRGFSQKVYFIYFQTENEQPFYLRMDNKIYSSGASGYLILSKLKDSLYGFSIGFPQSQHTELNFSAAIARKDHGYIIKNLGEKGWVLFNLQTLAIQMPVENKADEKTLHESGKNSAFTEMLSKASNDPSLKEKTTAEVSEEKKADTVSIQVAVKEKQATDSAAVVEIKKDQPKDLVEEKLRDQKQGASVLLKDSAVEVKTLKLEEIYKRSEIMRKSESSTTEGFGLVFIDRISNQGNDTIHILIPNPKPLVSIVDEKSLPEKKFLNIDTTAVISERPSDVQPVTVMPVIEKNIEKKNCSEQAGEADFFSLRKIMAAAFGDDEMIAEAKKYFKTKCFTTEQIRNLSVLFLTDAGKYKFYDVAYDFVTDTANFGLLQKELKDEYYINRFKAMLRN
ncbi:MAG: DUF4476 domain-containing protein [Sphingobacteriales bacterium]|nr:DUF4476 domain-containing protein [Sphingobacteriales bacterium]